MATVDQAAQASFNWILERDAVLPLTDGEIEDYIFAMNNYMLGLDAENVTLGYTIVSEREDDITIPGGTLRGLIANMAVELAPSYDAIVTPGLAQIALTGLKQMRLIGQSIGDSRYPYILPIGSGNEYDSGNLLWSHFYWEDEEVILAESTGSIGLESETNTVISNE